MISEADISQALTEYLKEIPDLLPAAWENKDFTGKLPYLVVEIVRVSRTDRTLKGGKVSSRGYMQVSVVRKLNEWATEAERLADTISDHFKYPQSLAVTGGKITIIKPPFIEQGYRDGSKWRLPVRIDYLAQ